MDKTKIKSDMKHYEQWVDELRSAGVALEDARRTVALENGYRTWWRLLAAIDAVRRSELPVKSLLPGADWKDYQREARELLAGARTGVAVDVQRFRDRMLKFANASDRKVSARATLGNARYVLAEEYGGRANFEHRIKAADRTPAQIRAWRECIWESHDRLGWSARTRSQMSDTEQQFVEAAMGDWVCLDQYASLPRLQAMLAKDHWLIETVGPAALARSLYWRKGEPIVRYLLGKGARLDHRHGIFGPVHEAVWQNQVESVSLILATGDIDAAQVAIEPPHGGLSSHRSLLHISARFSYVEMTALLLEHGADRAIEARLGKAGDTAMHCALKRWFDSDPFAERDPNGIPNHRSGREIISLLLDFGAHYDIHSASKLNDDVRVDELLATEPSLVHCAHEAGFTPLHYAARGGACESATVLLDAGAEVNANSSTRITPLHQASSVDIMALLIEGGADVNVQDSKGRTPLFMATQHGAADLAEFLIVLGADTTICNHKGRSPLDVATKACLYLKPR